MFSERQSLVSQLKDTHPRFQALYDKHHRLDQEIAKLEKDLMAQATMMKLQN